MIIEELIAVLGYDIRGEAELARFNKGIDAAERKARQASRTLSAMGVALGTFVGNLATQAAVQLGSTIGGLPGEIIKVGRTFENYRLQLETLEGSSAKAEEAMAWIKQFAKDTPLELADVIDSYASLKNFGIDPTNGSLMALVDAMAASGKGKEHLSGISLALGQAWAKEKLQGEEILQLVERGIPVWDLLSKATGKSSKELQELSSKGKLGRETIQLLIDAMGKKYEGASEKFAKSFDGVVSKLSDEWTEFLGNISDRGFYEEIKTRLEGVFETITRFRKDGTLDWLEEGFSKFLTGGVRAGSHIAQQIWDLGRGLYYAADGATDLVSRITGLSKGTSGTLLGAGALASTAGGRRLLMGIAKRVPWVAALLALDDIVTGLKGGDSYIGSLEGGQEAIDDVRGKLTGLREALESLSERLDLGLDWSAVTAPGDFINDAPVKFVREMANEIDRLTRAINEFSEGNIWGGFKKALGVKIEKGGLVDRIFGSADNDNSSHPYLQGDGAGQTARDDVTSRAEKDANDSVRPTQRGSMYDVDPRYQEDTSVRPEQRNNPDAGSDVRGMEGSLDFLFTKEFWLGKEDGRSLRDKLKFDVQGGALGGSETASSQDVSTDRVTQSSPPSEGGSVIIDLLQSLKGKMEAAASSPHVAQMVENLQGNLARMEAGNAARAVEQTVNDNRADNRNQSVTVNSTVNQTISQATQAAGAVGEATTSAVTRAATGGVRRISRAEKDDAF